MFYVIILYAKVSGIVEDGTVECQIIACEDTESGDS
jgi:hypothetical protein